METVLWIVGILVVLGIWGALHERFRSPTTRQMDFIDALIEERDVESWMLEKDPTTVKEASALIDKLKKMPYRKEEF